MLSLIVHYLVVIFDLSRLVRVSQVKQAHDIIPEVLSLPAHLYLRHWGHWIMLLSRHHGLKSVLLFKHPLRHQGMFKSRVLSVLGEYSARVWVKAESNVLIYEFSAFPVDV